MTRRLPLFLVAFALAILAGACPAAPPPEPSTPNEVDGSVPEAMRAAGIPWLCSLDGGRWCFPCTGTACPQGDSGALCCVGSVCVVWDGGQCSGVLGWCNNYTTTRSPTGIPEATCHDGAAQ